MKSLLSAFFACILAVSVTACAKLKPEDMYHYRPLSQSETPATIQEFAPINGLFEGWVKNEANARIFNARVANINGKPLFDPAYPTDPFPENSTAVLQLNPGNAVVTVLLEGQARTMFAGNAGVRSFIKMPFYAKAGERYKINGSGKDRDFVLWIEDSRGEKVIWKVLQVETRVRHY